MIKILGISGSRVKNGNVEALLKETLSPVQDRQGVQTEVINLAGKEINPCRHCNWCLGKQSEGKFCGQDDDMAAIFPKFIDADGLILASPAHFGRLSGLMADMIDRTRAFVHGNIYNMSLKDKVGGSIAVAFLRGGGIETTLSSLNQMFHAHQMIMANSGVYQLGAGVYSSPEGKGRFEPEIRHMVLEDEYGVMAAKALVERVVELARILKAGREALK